MKRPALPGLAIPLILTLTACSSSRHDPGEKFYLISANIKNGYWQTAGAGLDAAAKKLGVGAELTGPETYDPQAEAAAVRDAVSRKAAGILISVTDAAVLKEPIDAAIAQGVPVVTLDSDAKESKRLTFIGTNNYEAGLMGARVLVEQLHGKGNVAVLTMPGQPNLMERLQGYRNVFAENPQIRVAEVVNVKGDPGAAFDATKALLDKKPAPDAFVCLVSFACPEVADVLNRGNVTGKVVVAMDTDAGTLKWIDGGLIHATIAQKPYTMAYFGLMMLDNLHHEKLPGLDHPWAQDTRSPLPTFIDTGATLISKSNLEAFKSAQTAPAK